MSRSGERFTVASKQVRGVGAMSTTADNSHPSEEERAAFAAFGAQARKGYIADQGQTPQTIGYSPTDSPAGLAA
jgi:hypothetical protein